MTIDALELQSLAQIVPSAGSSACSVIPFAMRARMNVRLGFPVDDSGDSVAAALANDHQHLRLPSR
jgi:hypothetical protein